MSDLPRELDHVAAVVRDYLDDMVFADEAKLHKALHPGFFCIGNFNGGLEWDSRDAFVAGVTANADPPADGRYYHRILSTDVTGDAAMVKVENDYLGMRFTDYLTLLHLADGWVIVNKVFHHHAEPGSGAPAAA
jgi:hypothetical protein